jgi:hydrogenase-4 component E
MLTIFTGLFLIVARRKALTQVLGYLALENGIYLFGVCFASEGPIWVELGVLLDLLVAVLVMGIAVHRINQAFDSIDTARLQSLHD